MRDLVKDFVKISSEFFDIKEPIYEFGAFQVPDQMEVANFRP